MAKIINESMITLLNESSDSIIVNDPNDNIIFANTCALKLLKVNNISNIDISNPPPNLIYKEIILGNGYRAYIFSRKNNIQNLENTVNTFADVSHDLKNPLHSINGFTSALLEGIGGNLTDTQKKYISIISKNTTNLSLMIFNIIDISKYESGLLKANLTDISFDDFISSLNTRLLEYKFQNTVTLKLNNKNSSTEKLNSDGLILTQLLLNIISIISNNFDNEKVEINLEFRQNQSDKNEISMSIEKQFSKNNFWTKFIHTDDTIKGSEKLAIQACKVYLSTLSLELNVEILNDQIIFYFSSR